MSNANVSVRKPTKKQMFESLLAMPNLSNEQKEFINHELELLAKKNSGDKAPTATQKANAVLKDAIVEGMEANRYYTVTEMIKEIPALAGLNNQKVSPLANQLVADGKLIKTTEKRKSLFSLPTEV